jgi:hypothetical protein
MEKFKRRKVKISNSVNSISPEKLKFQLHEKIYRLIQYKFAEFLNLIYIIDVPEDQKIGRLKFSGTSRRSGILDFETGMAKSVV